MAIAVEVVQSWLFRKRYKGWFVFKWQKLCCDVLLWSVLCCVIAVVVCAVWR